MTTTSRINNLPLLGSIEAGGTKFNCALGYQNGDILIQTTSPTLKPNDTLKKASDFFQHSIAQLNQPLAALTIASFGPVDLDLESPGYGSITTTPKLDWSYINIVNYFSQTLNVPIVFTTDVNGAAWGEMIFGAASGCNDFIYVTVGTGIGAGVVVNGNLLQGVSHPEVGHMLMPTPLQYEAKINTIVSACPFHNNCLEGRASGTAMRLLWGEGVAQFAPDHAAWDLEADYLAAMCVNLTQCFSPEKIIFGGGVMQQQHLFPLIRKKFFHLINGYAPNKILDSINTYITPSTLEGKAAILGGLALAANRIK